MNICEIVFRTMKRTTD